ncbi:hypothetical protein FA15DRAFT_255360 [Coprinopsis marcescibilis]|uniref:Uncharacterized protein n=1 Tax=Coprinopsis marcescibilis TaxID=230819 RepID=A0A5C3L1D0_COPMA|nr:hypothetical protein FA15DRAFT_255360 [Coprinopsis marcescibilis]
MTRVPRTATPKERDPGMIANEGMIGGIIGGVILVFAIIFLVLFLLRRRKQRRVKLETQLFNNAPPVTPISQRIATFSFRSSSTNSTVPSVRSPITPRLQYTQSVVNSSIISPSVSASSNSDDPFSDLHDVRTSGASSDTTVVGASLFAANTKTLLIAPTPSDPFSDPAGVRDSDPFSDPTVPTQYVTLNLEPENFGRYSFSSAGHSMGSSIRSGRSGHGVGDGKGDAKRLSDASSLNSSQFVVTQAI